MTNTGMEITSRVSTSTRVSTSRPRLRPLKTPSRMPSTHSMLKATVVSFSVFGKAVPIRVVTGSPL